MKEFIKNLTEYSALLKEASIWKTSNAVLAPVSSSDGIGVATDNYVFEFYCYINLIVDLLTNYEIKYIEGKGNFKNKFPQAASDKKGKPRFDAYQDGVLKFQICAGTKVRCEFDSEENHPDISFQIGSASDDPSNDDLIIIMDAKFREDSEKSLPKAEVYKFSMVVHLFQLEHPPQQNVEFNKYASLKGNCLITNGLAYSNPFDVKYLNKYKIKEVERFYPHSIFQVLG